MLTDCNNIGSLLEIKDCLKKCCTQQRIREKFKCCLESCSENGTAERIKSQISQDEINTLNEKAIFVFS